MLQQQGLSKAQLMEIVMAAQDAFKAGLDPSTDELTEQTAARSMTGT